MRRNYRKMQEEILPSMETQDWMWETIEKKAAQGEKKQGLKPWLKMAASIAAAVCLFFVLLPQTSLAEHIQGFLEEFFYAGADVGPGIAKNVYEDTGKYGHVKMQVQEMLSDGSFVYCNICYEALDAWGEKWLAEQEFENGDIRVSWVLDNDDGWFEGGGTEIREQKELATEKTRYLAFLINESSGKFKLKDRSVTLFYPMYKSQGIGKVDIVSNLETVSYRLVGDKSPSKYYEPKYLMVSKLSYGLFGINHGANGSYQEGNTWYFQLGKGFAEEKGDGDDIVYEDGLPLSFTMENGMKVDMGYAPPAFGIIEDVPGCDLLISAGHYNVDSEKWYLNMPIENPGTLTGVEIDGVHYDLVKEDPTTVSGK